MTFAELMKAGVAAKKAEGYTSNDLRIMAGVPHNSWHTYLAGTRHPPVETAARIARALDIDVRLADLACLDDCKK